jgi:hypothetical protein
MSNTWSLWVGGIEVNDYYLPFDEAFALGYEWRNKGYEDVYLRNEANNG